MTKFGIILFFVGLAALMVSPACTYELTEETEGQENMAANTQTWPYLDYPRTTHLVSSVSGLTELVPAQAGSRIEVLQIEASGAPQLDVDNGPCILQVGYDSPLNAQWSGMLAYGEEEDTTGVTSSAAGYINYEGGMRLPSGEALNGLVFGAAGACAVNIVYRYVPG